MGSPVTYLSSNQLNDIFGWIDTELRSSKLEKFSLKLRLYKNNTIGCIDKRIKRQWQHTRPTITPRRAMA